MAAHPVLKYDAEGLNGIEYSAKRYFADLFIVLFLFHANDQNEREQVDGTGTPPIANATPPAAALSNYLDECPLIATPPCSASLLCPRPPPVASNGARARFPESE